MEKQTQPETLEVIVDDQNDHENVDGTVSCEGGARSSGKGSKIFSDRKDKPVDTAIRDALEKVKKATTK